MAPVASHSDDHERTIARRPAARAPDQLGGLDRGVREHEHLGKVRAGRRAAWNASASGAESAASARSLSRAGTRSSAPLVLVLDAEHEVRRHADARRASSAAIERCATRASQRWASDVAMREQRTPPRDCRASVPGSSASRRADAATLFAMPTPHPLIVQGRRRTGEPGPGGATRRTPDALALAGIRRQPMPPRHARRPCCLSRIPTETWRGPLRVARTQTWRPRRRRRGKR